MLKRFILWSFDFGDFSIKVFKIFNEDLFIGDFSYKIYSLEIFPWKFEIFFFFLKSYLEDLKKKDLFMEIFRLKYEDFSLRFIQEIFPLQFWKTLMKICP